VSQIIKLLKKNLSYGGSILVYVEVSERIKKKVHEKDKYNCKGESTLHNKAKIFTR
jgi:hypothetical protein